MDRAIFVENIKKYCAQRGVKPTVACRESGAGADLINQMERRGSIPSVERVQQLAQYLGVTTSELLGEAASAGAAIEIAGEELDIIEAYRRADDRAKEMIRLALGPWFPQEKSESQAM